MVAVAEFQNLPKRLQNRPDVRALALRVYPDPKNPRLFRVPGRSQIYDVYVVNGEPHCICQAAAHKIQCSHAIAVASFIKERTI